MTENSTTFEIDLLVPGLIAPLDPKAGIVLWRNHASGRCGECPLSGPFPPFGQQPLSAQLRRQAAVCYVRNTSNQSSCFGF